MQDSTPINNCGKHRNLYFILIAGPADDNGEHAERDGICENPDRWSRHSSDGGCSIDQPCKVPARYKMESEALVAEP